MASILLAALVATALALVAMAFVAHNSAVQALARGSEGPVAVEQRIQRGGTMLVYQTLY